MEQFYSRCLLCTCRPDVTPHLHIFSEDGKQLQLADKIKYLNIEIEVELPQNVCHSCMEKLEVTHELVTSSQQARIILLQMKQQSEEVKQENCSMTELDSYQSATDSAAIDDENVTIPKIYEMLMNNSVANCSAEDSDQSGINFAVQLSEVPVHFTVCNSKSEISAQELLGSTAVKNEMQDFVESPQLAFENDLNFHKIEHDRDLITGQQDVGTEETRDISFVECQTLKDTERGLATLDSRNTVASQTKVTQKRRYNYGGAVYCEICSEWTADKYSLVQHKNKIHGTNLSFDCEYCGKKLVTLEKIRNHIRSIHSAKDHFCGVCGKALTKRLYTSHIKRHQPRQNVRARRKMLNTALTPAWCGMCGHQAIHKYAVLKHINSEHLDVVMEPLPFCCDLCDKTSAKYDYFMQHFRRTHTRMQQCEHCDKMIAWNKMPKHLQLHQLGNSKDEMRNSHNLPVAKVIRRELMRSMNCKQCGVKYSNPEMLAWHIENCHGNSPTIKILYKGGNHYNYQCVFCDTVFSMIYSVISHLRDKHDLVKLPFHCTYCNKQFVRKTYLRNHKAKCKKNMLVNNGESSAQVQHMENVEYSEETLTSEIDIEEHAIKLEPGENQPCCLPQKADVVHPLERILPKCRVLVSKLLECDFCCFYTNNKTQLATHMQTHL